MSNTTVPASQTQEDTLTLAQWARVNLIMLSLASQATEDFMAIWPQAIFAAAKGLMEGEFDRLRGVATARCNGGRPPFGGSAPHVPLFSNRTHGCEHNEAAEAHLARGNQSFAIQDFDFAYDAYVDALKAADRSYDS